MNNEQGSTHSGAPAQPIGWMTPLEAISALLVAGIVLLLFTGVVSRYVFTKPIDWIDETVSMGFIWVGMIGAALAMHRNEHLRLTTFVERMPPAIRSYVQAFALVSVIAFLIGMIAPAFDYVRDEWVIAMPALQIPNSFRVAAIAVGIVLMLLVVCIHALRNTQRVHLLTAVAVVGVVSLLCYLGMGQFAKLGSTNLLIFLVLMVAILLVAGVPIAFCFGLGVLSYLLFTTDIPLQIVVSRM
ncbi:MAG: dicarboxylate transporter, subunit DctM, partial [Pseudomonadota bacterium]